MGKDVLVILMMAFGLFAILMFILFYIYAKKNYNDKHINEDYTDLLGEDIELVEILINNEKQIFDVNEYSLSVNEKVKVVIDGKIVDGIVTKANYRENLDKLAERPLKLLLNKDINSNQVSIDDEMELVPLKKK